MKAVWFLTFLALLPGCATVNYRFNDRNCQFVGITEGNQMILICPPPAQEPAKDSPGKLPF